MAKSCLVMTGWIAAALVAGCVMTGPVEQSPHKVGHVDVVQSENMIGMIPSWSAEMSADFYVDPCQYQLIGLCTLSRCPAPGTDGGVPDAGAPADPGPIHISVPGTALTLMPAGDGSYLTAEAGGGGLPVFAAKGAIEVKADGAILPSFTLEVPVPATATVLSPISFPHAVDRASNLNVSWSGLTGDTMEVEVWSGDEQAPVALLRCELPGGESSQIPSAALSLLPPGPGGLRMRSLNTASVLDGDYGVTATVATMALDNNGDVYEQKLNLQ
ncbi:MAG TPA: hypothetical protein VII38_22260 [Polyangia bacterium]